MTKSRFQLGASRLTDLLTLSRLACALLVSVGSAVAETSKGGSSQPANKDHHADGEAVDEFMGDVTGTVVNADEKRGYIEIDRGKQDGRGNFEVVLVGDLRTPKVGEKVKVHWYACGGGSIHVSNRDRAHCADKIEQLGNAEGAVSVPVETAETEFKAAKQEYGASSHDESARLVYVNKLAKIRDRQIQNYWKTGDNSFDSATATNEELRKHPAPANSDSKKLSQFLIGKWRSPRHIYVFRANGKCGNKDGPITSNWRIQGNQLIQEGSHGTIILVNSDYLIYAEKDAVFFHARVKE